MVTPPYRPTHGNYNVIRKQNLQIFSSIIKTGSIETNLHSKLELKIRRAYRLQDCLNRSIYLHMNIYIFKCWKNLYERVIITEQTKQ